MSAAAQYKEILSTLKAAFASTITEMQYHDLVAQMRAYLTENDNITERHELQKPVNIEAGHPADYDFDYRGNGPSHIRWNMNFLN